MLYKTLIFISLILSCSDMNSKDWHRVDIDMGIGESTNLYYVDSANAYVMQPYDGANRISLDGGNTWEQLHDPMVDNRFRNYIDFQGDTIYAVYHNLTEEFFFLLKSWDLTREWTQIIQIDASEHIPSSVYYVYDDKTAYHAKIFDKGMGQGGWDIFKTNNKGITWEKRKGFAGNTLEHLFFVDDNTTIAVLSSNRVAKTDSNMIVWTNYPIKTNYETTYKIIDKDVSYTAFRNAILKTENDWITWDTLLVADGESTIMCLDVSDNGSIYAAQRNGNVYNYRASNSEWTKDSISIDVDGEMNVQDIQAISEDKAVIKVSNTMLQNYAYLKNFDISSSVETLMPKSDLGYIQVYPSVVQNGESLNITINNTSILDIQLIDVNGKSINNLNEGTNDIKDLARGRYYIIYNSEGTPFTIPIQVE